MAEDMWATEYWFGRWRPYVLLLVLGCCFYLPGLWTLPPTDRDESRFAQASRQMLESGDYLNIRFQEMPRNKKPIGIYWLQAAVAGAAGADPAAIWPYRLPSAIGALAALLLTFHFGRQLFDRKIALIGAVFLGSCLLLTVEAHLAKTDAVLLAITVAMQGALGKIYLDLRAGREDSVATARFFWIACGLGVLVKGPIPAAIALLTVSALMLADHSLAFVRSLRPLSGMAILSAIVLPWVVAISLATGGAFLHDALATDLLPKLAGGQESHGAPPGYYLLLIFALFWPASLPVFWSLLPSWRARSDAAVRFCLAWALPTWLLFELVPTKLPHYVLPAFPALSLLAARFLLSGSAPLRRHSRTEAFFFWLPVALWAVVAITLAVGLTLVPLHLNGYLDPASLPVMAGCLLVLAGFYRYRRQGRPYPLVIHFALGGFLVLAPTFQTILPHLQGPWLSTRIQELVQKHRPGTTPQLTAVGYGEPSLVFLLGTGTKLTDTVGAVDYLRRHDDALAVVRDRDEADFRSAAGVAGISLVPLETVEGFNYSRGKSLALRLFSRREAAVK